MEWIEISKKLPNDQEWVLVWFIAETGKEKSVSAQYVRGGFFVNGNKLTVTHWLRPIAPIFN